MKHEMGMAYNTYEGSKVCISDIKYVNLMCRSSIQILCINGGILSKYSILLISIVNLFLKNVTGKETVDMDSRLACYSGTFFQESYKLAC
jgi:hypothetical protein